MRKLARLTAEAIAVSVAVITAPARWTSDWLRCYADRSDGPGGEATAAQAGDEPSAAK